MSKRTQRVKVVGSSKTIIKAFGNDFIILNKETVQKLYIYIYSQINNKNNKKNVNSVYEEWIKNFNISYGYSNKYRVAYLSGRIAPPRSFAKDPSRILVNDEDFKTVIDSMYKSIGNKSTNPAKLQKLFASTPYGWFTCKKSCREYLESISDNKRYDSDGSDDSDDSDGSDGEHEEDDPQKKNIITNEFYYDSDADFFKSDSEDSSNESIFNSGIKNPSFKRAASKPPKSSETTQTKKRNNSYDEDFAAQSHLTAATATTTTTATATTTTTNDEKDLPSFGIENPKRKIKKTTSMSETTPNTASKNPTSPSTPQPTQQPTTTTNIAATSAPFSNTNAPFSNTNASSSNTTAASSYTASATNNIATTGSAFSNNNAAFSNNNAAFSNTNANFSNNIATSSNTNSASSNINAAFSNINSVFSNTTKNTDLHPSFVNREIVNPSINTGSLSSSSSSAAVGEEALNIASLKKDIKALENKVSLMYETLTFFINNTTAVSGEANKKLEKIKF
ncbi:hypothetical protein ACTFIW_005559 [Dictyostelium discoideum]